VQRKVSIVHTHPSKSSSHSALSYILIQFKINRLVLRCSSSMPVRSLLLLCLLLYCVISFVGAPNNNTIKMGVPAMREYITSFDYAPPTMPPLSHALLIILQNNEPDNMVLAHSADGILHKIKPSHCLAAYRQGKWGSEKGLITYRPTVFRARRLPLHIGWRSTYSGKPTPTHHRAHTRQTMENIRRPATLCQWGACHLRVIPPLRFFCQRGRTRREDALLLSGPHRRTEPLASHRYNCTTPRSWLPSTPS